MDGATTRLRPERSAPGDQTSIRSRFGWLGKPEGFDRGTRAQPKGYACDSRYCFLDIPEDFLGSPELADENWTQIIENAWGDFFRHGVGDRLSNTQLDKFLQKVETTAGTVLGPRIEVDGRDASSRQGWVLTWALDLLSRFRDLIPNEGTCCPDAGEFTGELFDEERIRVRVNRTAWRCTNDEVPVDTCSCSGLTFTQDFDVTGIRVTTAWVPPKFIVSLPPYVVHVCQNYLDALARVVDENLRATVTIAAYVRGGNLNSVPNPADEMLKYMDVATIHARVALGAVANVASTILHEFMHFLAGNSHCHNNCCHARIAMKFLCNITAKLGLYAASLENLDDRGYGTALLYTSKCAGGDNGEFKTACGMLNPGTPSAADAWLKVDYDTADGEVAPDFGSMAIADWTNPAGCGTSRC